MPSCQELKDWVTKAPISKDFEPTHHIVVETDESTIAIGAALSDGID